MSLRALLPAACVLGALPLAPRPSATDFVLTPDMSVAEVIEVLESGAEVSLRRDGVSVEALCERACGLVSELTASKAELLPVAEQIFSVHGLVLVAEEASEPRAWTLRLESEALADGDASEAVTVEAASTHSALTVRVVEDLPHLNAIQVEASLGPLLVGHAAGVAVVEDGLEFRGPGAHVASLVEVLRALDPGRPMPETRPATAHPFVEPDAPLLVKAKVDLLSLLLDYEALTGLHLVLAPDARADLGHTRASLAELEVPTGDVHGYVSRVLYLNGFSSSLIGSTAPALIAIHAGRDRGRRRPLLVSVENRSELEVMPSLIVSLVADTGTADALRLSVLMRPLIAGAVPDPFILANHERRMVLCGRAGDLVPCVSAIERELAEVR